MAVLSTDEKIKRCDATMRWRRTHLTLALQLDRASKRRVKEFINSLKDKPCADCGNSYPHYVMHFDHLPQYEKKFNISNPRTTRKDKILAEIAKCELVCANCHAVRTYGREERAYGHNPLLRKD
jgi:hypothetical protein